LLPGLRLDSVVLASLDLSLVRGLLWGLFFLLATILLLRALYEPTQLEITRRCLSSVQSDNDLSEAIPRIHAPDLVLTDETILTIPAGLRVALLSDLHAEWLRLKPERIAQALAAEEFDLVLFAGDLTGRHHRPDRAKPWLDALAVVCQRLGKACYAVPGNHDSPASLDLLGRAGFTILKNDSHVIRDRSGRDWLLIGLDILKKGQPDFAQALKRTTASGYASSSAAGAGPRTASGAASGTEPWMDARASIPPERRIVLAHNPDTFFLVPAGQAGFFLAGHFHGGQIYLPFHLEFFILRREKLGRMGYHKGSFALNGLTGYISRGLGSVLFPLRLGSMPELAILELRPATQAATAQEQEVKQ